MEQHDVENMLNKQADVCKATFFNKSAITKVIIALSAIVITVTGTLIGWAMTVSAVAATHEVRIHTVEAEIIKLNIEYGGIDKKLDIAIQKQDEILRVLKK